MMFHFSNNINSFASSSYQAAKCVLASKSTHNHFANTFTSSTSITDTFNRNNAVSQDVEMVYVENMTRTEVTEQAHLPARSPVDNNARRNVLASNNARNIFVTCSTFTTNTFAINPFTRNNVDSQDVEMVDVENKMEIEVTK